MSRGEICIELRNFQQYSVFQTMARMPPTDIICFIIICNILVYSTCTYSTGKI